MKLVGLWLALAFLLRSETIDKVAIAIGHRAITQSEIDEELRVAALLNHQPVVRTQDSRRDAADRLIQQFLIKREMQLNRYPAPSDAELAGYLDQVEKDSGGPSHLAAALRTYDLDKSTLESHLTLQLETLKFIETRFRPELSVSDADVQALAGRQATTLDKDSVRRRLTEQRADEALGIWLEEARKQFDIVYLDNTLR